MTWGKILWHSIGAALFGIAVYVLWAKVSPWAFLGVFLMIWSNNFSHSSRRVS